MSPIRVTHGVAIACAFVVFALSACGSDAERPIGSPPQPREGGEQPRPRGGGDGQSRVVSFPDDFDDMVMYGDFRSGSEGHLAYALPETLEIAKSGRQLPPGTSLVLEIYDDNDVGSYFVMQKGEGWGRDYPEDVRNGDWHFQQFDTDEQVSADSDPQRCMSCHFNGADDDFTLTRDEMEAYMP